MSNLVLGIDTGGTYTDGVILEQNTRKIIKTTKTLTTRSNLAIGILAALDDLLPEDPTDIKLVAISTTLATNAIAEKKGRPVALFLLGYDQGLVEEFNLGQKFATSHFHYIEGGHTLNGRPQAPLDLDTLLQKATTLKDQVEAFAISGYFSPFNASHEEKAFQAVTKTVDRPVILGHELASKLNSIERATTATLNASLLAPLQNFMSAMEHSLEERGINAPLMVVRGDGALVNSELAKKRPVETVHSGPAASAIGGRFLSQEDRAVVVDIGGTTTDIALLENGQVTVREEGTTVGDYNTAVRAAHIHSLGLGGDSRITLNAEDQIVIGPERVTPISYLASSDPMVARDLQKLSTQRQKPFSLQNLEYWYLLREPSHALRNSRTREVFYLLEKGPMALPDILEELDLFHPLQFGGGKLIREEIIGRSGLTPTDLLHVSGEFSPWRVEAAQTGAALAAQLTGMDVDTLVAVVKNHIAERICAEVISFITGKTIERVPHYIDPDDLGLWLFEENLYQKSPYLGSTIRLKIPLIGIGAPAEIFLPPVAKMLHTELITPPHYQVANAVGAVAGSVVSNREAWVLAQTRNMRPVGYLVQSGKEQKRFPLLEEALTYAKEITGEKALKEARKIGVVDPHVAYDQLPDGADSYRIRAQAIGNPKLGGDE